MKTPFHYFRQFSWRICLLWIIYYAWTMYLWSPYTLGMAKQILYRLACFNDAQTLCFLKNPFHRKIQKTPNCVNCEGVFEIRKLYDTTFYEINTIYMKNNIPVVVIDAMFDWKVMKYNLDLKNFTEIYKQAEKIIPCEISSNINHVSNVILDILHEISEINMESWFIKWSNCDIKTAKLLRNVYEQPYFFELYYPAPRKNSIFISKNYATSNYQQVKMLDHEVLLLMQVRGSSKFKLVPKETCKRECAPLIGILEETQILVLSSALWQLWYAPGSGESNVCITTEYGEEE